MVDWLEIVDKAGGEAAWVTQQKNFTTRKGKRRKPKDSNEIIEMILKMESVQRVIRGECAKRNTTGKLLSDEARLILRSIAHQMQLLVIRSVGYVIAKTIRVIYDGVYFNDQQLLRIREYSTDDPIIFMPTHRSYMDFLIVSLLCFNHNLSLPVVATGMDFMTSRFLGETLRRCGSFFMKRQFGKDKLYWSLFTSYVQMQLREMDNPIEFFLEGTRSRSGKSLYPKFGLLQMCLEPFFRCQLYDLIVVPVTIDYDKVLEEFLYAYELFGFPKPQETTTGLFKSREILSKRFGHIYVNFGEPISVRKYFDQRINRWCPPWQVNVDNKLSDKEKGAVKDFALHIIYLQNSNSTITVWPYTCAILLQMKSTSNQKLIFSELQTSLEQFITLIEKMGRRIIVKRSITDDLRYHLKLHSDLFQCDILFPNSLIEMKRFKCPKNNGLKKDYIEGMLCEVILSHYANQMMHDFVDVSLLCHILLSNQIKLSNQAFSRASHIFRELRSLFVYEFVCSLQEEEIQKLFMESLNCLLQISAVSLSNGCIIVEEEHILRQIAFLMQPFIARYYCVMQSLVQLVGTQFTDKVLFEKSLQLAVTLYAREQGNNTSCSICITSDVIRNALSAFCKLQTTCRCSEKEYAVNIYRLQIMMELLESISMMSRITVQSISSTQPKYALDVLRLLDRYVRLCMLGPDERRKRQSHSVISVWLKCVSESEAGIFKFSKTVAGRAVGCSLFGIAVGAILSVTEMVRTKANVKKYDVSSNSSKNSLTIEESVFPLQNQNISPNRQLPEPEGNPENATPTEYEYILTGGHPRYSHKAMFQSKRRSGRYKPGEKAEKEVRKYQKSTKLLLKKLPFSRLVREITAELTASNGYHFAVEGIAALQEASEAFLVQFFENSMLCCSHAKRVTLMTRDVQLVRRLFNI
ncbi:unnamed protein product [Litomosoides sigmodontis]|uniref:Phospholipid/glycerol acyltransferase domain-containing protein n=1 Tax=Litomosoides sigmodontis TaxID=42156 RepID=A0A3P6SI05_LITSI|nr:unnamed protein product [Litomosoides sigmodontis]